MILDPESFTTAQVEKYLSGRGWFCVGGTWKTEWGDEGVYLHIPAKNCDRYIEDMIHVLQVIAGLERREAKNVLGDIQVN